VTGIGELRRPNGDVSDFKEFLRSGPDFDELELIRQRDLPRDTEAVEDGKEMDEPKPV
jgi:hypothetical protein